MNYKECDPFVQPPEIIEIEKGKSIQELRIVQDFQLKIYSKEHIIIMVNLMYKVF